MVGEVEGRGTGVVLLVTAKQQLHYDYVGLDDLQQRLHLRGGVVQGLQQALGLVEVRASVVVQRERRHGLLGEVCELLEALEGAVGCGGRVGHGGEGCEAVLEAHSLAVELLARQRYLAALPQRYHGLVVPPTQLEQGVTQGDVPAVGLVALQTRGKKRTL